jgi:hypothetical protein
MNNSVSQKTASNSLLILFTLFSAYLISVRPLSIGSDYAQYFLLLEGNSQGTQNYFQKTVIGSLLFYPLSKGMISPFLVIFSLHALALWFFILCFKGVPHAVMAVIFVGGLFFLPFLFNNLRQAAAVAISSWVILRLSRSKALWLSSSLIFHTSAFLYFFLHNAQSFRRIFISLPFLLIGAYLIIMNYSNVGLLARVVDGSSLLGFNQARVDVSLGFFFIVISTIIIFCFKNSRRVLTSNYFFLLSLLLFVTFQSLGIYSELFSRIAKLLGIIFYLVVWLSFLSIVRQKAVIGVALASLSSLSLLYGLVD